MSFPTRREMYDAQAQLTKAGWTHILTIMADKSTQADGYGLLYAKGDERFWMNKDTIKNLPIEVHCS